MFFILHDINTDSCYVDMVTCIIYIPFHGAIFTTTVLFLKTVALYSK